MGMIAKCLSNAATQSAITGGMLSITCDTDLPRVPNLSSLSPRHFGELQAITRDLTA